MKRYKYKNRTYYIESIGKFKHPDTREWIEAVIYISEDTGNRYIREVEEFYRIFEDIGYE